MANVSAENKHRTLDDVKEIVAMGIAGVASGITVQLCGFPLGRSISPREDGEMVFKIVNTELLNIFERRKRH